MTSAGPQTPDPFASAQVAAGELAQRTGARRHDVAVVLGTGLAAASTALGVSHEPFDLSELTGFFPCTGIGHRTAAWSCSVGGRRALVLAGRVHLYEGLSAAQVVHPIRTAIAAGCHTVILTCAVGGIRADLTTGTLALIADHLNLTGRSPLTGVASSHRPSPFVDLTDTWCRTLRSTARRHDPDLPEVVLAQMPGPHLESPAEIMMLATLGADVVGMSSVIEAIAAHHLGANVAGIAAVTNAAAGLGDGPIEVDRIHAEATTLTDRLGVLLRALVETSPR